MLVRAAGVALQVPLLSILCEDGEEWRLFGRYRYRADIKMAGNVVRGSARANIGGPRVTRPRMAGLGQYFTRNSRSTAREGQKM